MTRAELVMIQQTMEYYIVTEAKKNGRYLGEYRRNSDSQQIVDVISGNGTSWPYYSIGVLPKDNNAPVRRFETIGDLEKLYTQQGKPAVICPRCENCGETLRNHKGGWVLCPHCALKVALTG